MRRNEFRRIRASHFGPDQADPYTVLGVDHGASEEEIKRTYRLLVRENHPDSLMARGVPEEFLRLANRQARRDQCGLRENHAGAAVGLVIDIIERPSPNFDARPDGAAIDMLVLHYTGMRTAEEALARLCDPAAKVSAHYTIDREGRVFRHVAEAQRAGMPASPGGQASAMSMADRSASSSSIPGMNSAISRSPTRRSRR